MFEKFFLIGKKTFTLIDDLFGLPKTYIKSKLEKLSFVILRSYRTVVFSRALLQSLNKSCYKAPNYIRCVYQSYCREEFPDMASTYDCARSNLGLKNVCKHCPASFARRNALYCHLDTEHRELRYACNSCNTTCSSKAGLKKHRCIAAIDRMPCRNCGGNCGGIFRHGTEQANCKVSF